MLVPTLPLLLDDEHPALARSANKIKTTVLNFE
jgi:hypothetical protein